MKLTGIAFIVFGVGAIVSLIVLLWLIGVGVFVFPDPDAALGAGFLTAVVGITLIVAGVTILADEF